MYGVAPVVCEGFEGYYFTFHFLSVFCVLCSKAGPHTSSSLLRMGVIEREARDDPWPLILALPQVADEASLELVSTALARFEPSQLEFFTPQLWYVLIPA